MRSVNDKICIHGTAASFQLLRHDPVAAWETRGRLEEECSETLEWAVTGPEESPYEGGRFILEITVPPNFPAAVPEVVCKTPIWHPNITTGPGGFCLFRKLWSPKNPLRFIVSMVEDIFKSPNPVNSENVSAWKQLRTDQDLFARTATFWTTIFAGGRGIDHDFHWKTKALMRQGFSQYRAVQLLSILNWDDDKIGVILASDFGKIKSNK